MKEQELANQSKLNDKSNNKNGNQGVMPMAYNPNSGNQSAGNNKSSGNTGADQTNGKLPQTGEYEDNTMTTIGLGALLGASALFFRKRKEDEEAQER